MKYEVFKSQEVIKRKKYRLCSFFGILFFRSLMPRSAYLRKFLPSDEHSAQVSRDGFTHTLGEICQQPELWEITAHQIGAILDRWQSLLAGVNCIALTGSGSSGYVGECLSYAVQEHTSVTTVSRPSGAL